MQQENELAVGLAEGRALFGASAETGVPSIVELYGSLGLDWVWLDLEHKNPSAYDSSYLEGMVRAAECANTELIVRVPDTNPAGIRKVLDAGVRNIIVPRVETAADVRRAVKASQYEYAGQPGERGISFGRASTYGTSLTMDGDTQFHHVEDENVLVGALIENTTAIENLDAILDVPELGFIFPGPGDLGVSMGHTLDYGHPEVSEALRTIESKCMHAGVPLLGLLGSNFQTVPDAKEAIENGYQLVGIGNEFSILKDSLTKTLAEFSD